MKQLKRIGYLLSAIVLYSVTIAPIVLGGWMDNQAWDARLECAGGFRAGEQISARLTFWTMPQNDGYRTADSVRVELSVIGALTLAGPRQWRLTLNGDTSFTHEVEITIPAKDTSAIYFAVWWGTRPAPYKVRCYFVTTGPQVELYYGVPTPIGPMPWEVEAKTIRMGDSLERIASQRPPRPFEGIGRTYYNIAPEDSVYLDSISESSKKYFVHMRLMEDSAWTGEDRQVYMIEKLYFARNPGEKKFRRIEGHTDPLAEGTRWRDSVLAVSPPAKYDIIIDLRDPDDYDYVKTLVDSLGVTEEKGFYRTVTSKAVLGKLAEHGIEFRNTFWRTRPPNQQVDDSARSKVPGRGDVIEGDERDNRNDLFLEGRAAHSLECIL